MNIPDQNWAWLSPPNHQFCKTEQPPSYHLLVDYEIIMVIISYQFSTGANKTSRKLLSTHLVRPLCELAATEYRTNGHFAYKTLPTQYGQKWKARR